MNQSRTARERIILTVAGSLALVYILVEYVAEPFYEQQRGQEQKIENKIYFISKYHEILNQTDYYREKERSIQMLSAEIPKLFLASDQPALAAAELQKSLEKKAKKARITLAQVKVEKAKNMENLIAIPLKINTKTTLKKLSQLIRSIENDTKFLVIEDLAARRTNNREPEQLEAQLLVIGFIKQKFAKT